MEANPFLGLILHSIGGLAAASFYLPYRKVQRWSWETYWIVGGFFSWIIVPWVAALILVPDLLAILRTAPAHNVLWAYLFGVMWGIGGLTFGLSMRYLGMSLGYAMALGLCAAFGTLMPPIFDASIANIVRHWSGWLSLGGVAICLAGIAISGAAGMAKERELTSAQKKATISEFSFLKGCLVAILAGVMSAAMSYGIAAGKPVAKVAGDYGAAQLWQGLPSLIIIFAGGFTTNFIWCVTLNIRNGSGRDYLHIPPAPAADQEKAVGQAVIATAPARTSPGAILLANYALSATAGTVWYLQFFFFTMGAPLMGRYGFSSWSLHMASIIIFSSLWGLYLREWKGVSNRALALVWAGIIILMGSMVMMGLGTAMAPGKG